MSQSPFDAPAPPGSKVPFDELVGALLVFEPEAVEKDVKTTLGTKDATRATVNVLDGPLAGTEYASTLIFPSVLQGQLRSRMGRKVLGRLTQGVARPGQDPPWMLLEATEQDNAQGVAWLNSRQRQAFAPPPQQQPVQAQPQYQQPVQRPVHSQQQPPPQYAQQPYDQPPF